jgi:hypothetical protein
MYLFNGTIILYIFRNPVTPFIAALRPALSAIEVTGGGLSWGALFLFYRLKIDFTLHFVCDFMFSRRRLQFHSAGTFLTTLRFLPPIKRPNMARCVIPGSYSSPQCCTTADSVPAPENGRLNFTQRHPLFLRTTSNHELFNFSTLQLFNFSTLDHPNSLQTGSQLSIVRPAAPGVNEIDFAPAVPRSQNAPECQP